MTDRFSPSLPSNGKVKVSLVRRVAGVVARLATPWHPIRRGAPAGPALILWRFDYRAARLGLGAPDLLKPVN